jgi:hypothetical protein
VERLHLNYYFDGYKPKSKWSTSNQQKLDRLVADLKFLRVEIISLNDDFSSLEYDSLLNVLKSAL